MSLNWDMPRHDLAHVEFGRSGRLRLILCVDRTLRRPAEHVEARQLEGAEADLGIAVVQKKPPLLDHLVFRKIVLQQHANRVRSPVRLSWRTARARHFGVSRFETAT